MGKSQKGRVASLSRTLQRVTTALNETFALLAAPAPAADSAPSDWSEAKKASDVVSKNATAIGLLWTQPTLKVDEADAAMKTFAESLQGLILLCHGFTAGAGPTLTLTIQSSVKSVLAAGLSLLASVVSFSVKGSSKDEREAALPSLVGCVWEACNAVKKTPSTNRAAIGRSLAQLATSVKDVLREIGEMHVGDTKQADGCGCGHDHEEAPHSSHRHSHSHSRGQTSHIHSHSHNHSHGHDGACGHDHSHGESSHSHNHSHDGACGHGHSHSHGGHEHCGGDGASSAESLEFDDELSEEEMQVADATKGVVSSLLAFLKELLYVAADAKQGNDEAATLYLENVLKQCKSLSVQVDEFGASLYPPQEINKLRERATNSDAIVGAILLELKARGDVPHGVEAASQAVSSALVELQQRLGGLSS